ncbi:hypothetical protein H6P81_014868 [Aristolochia fimbriata]|uniref:Uncharacterized protein n=1 Tax=Aristolochia fimbriata TaxID=158543 RepID=A0AAV7E3V5_ARIFI|nr:hypothetical protein H6P81_014868 [Aristolochia fimbriata]
MAASLSSFCPVPHPRFLSKPISRPRPSSLGALASSKMDNEPYWVSINADITAYLKLRLPTGSVPLVLHQSVHHLVSTTPPTLAPALCVAACEVVGGHRSTSLAVASALRLMHVASFTHHNLHNFPSLPANIALLSGDAILPLGYELAAGAVHDGEVDPERALRVIAEIAHAMGAKGAIHVGEKKEGALFPCGAACGAILGGAEEERIEKLRRLGFYTGMLLLGVTGRRGIKSHEKGSSSCPGDVVPKTAEGLRSLALMELKGLQSRATASDALSGCWVRENRLLLEVEKLRILVKEILCITIYYYYKDQNIIQQTQRGSFIISCLLAGIFKGLLALRISMASVNGNAPSWADQWGAGGTADGGTETKKAGKDGNKKMAEVKAAASAGLSKAKAAATVGAQKVKTGTSVGMKWVKAQYQKRSSK